MLKQPQQKKNFRKRSFPTSSTEDYDEPDDEQKDEQERRFRLVH